MHLGCCRAHHVGVCDQCRAAHLPTVATLVLVLVFSVLVSLMLAEHVQAWMQRAFLGQVACAVP
jgi:sensor histidine kinase regulating citrate/malate metabolism